MRKRALYPLLAGLLALGLTACGIVSEMPSPSPSPTAPPEASAPVSEEPITVTPPEGTAPSSEQPIPSVEPSAPPETAFSLPDREYEPWQRAYMEFLSELTAREWKDIQAYEALSDEEKQTEAGKALDRPWDRSDSYFLYDVDEDGEPELFVLFGNCEVAYVMRCYTFRDGEVALAGEFNFWHSTLYTCPGRNAVLQWQGHWNPVEYTLEDGRLKKVGSILLEADDMWEWEETDLGEVVPGAVNISAFRTRADNSTGAALLLPICNYYEDVPEQSKIPPEEARAAILESLFSKRPLRSVYAYPYDGGTEWMTWEEYIPNDIFGPFQIQAHVWAEMGGKSVRFNPANMSL